MFVKTRATKHLTTEMFLVPIASLGFGQTSKNLESKKPEIYIISMGNGCSNLYHLQHHQPSVANMIPHPGLESNIGKLLIYFLQMFGYNFEYMRFKIVVRTDGTGCWTEKADPTRMDSAPTTMLSIDDPLDPSTCARARRRACI